MTFAAYGRFCAVCNHATVLGYESPRRVVWSIAVGLFDSSIQLVLQRKRCSVEPIDGVEQHLEHDFETGYFHYVLHGTDENRSTSVHTSEQ